MGMRTPLLRNVLAVVQEEGAMVIQEPDFQEVHRLKPVIMVEPAMVMLVAERARMQAPAAEVPVVLEQRGELPVMVGQVVFQVLR